MENIFALDIGTRKIVGLVMQKSDQSFIVLDSEMREHRTRAMIDGQIHDVEAVAETIREIKLALEMRMNIKLEYGAIAAAGRALKTAPGSTVQKRATLEEISREEVLALEIEAVQQGQFNLMEDDNNTSNSDYFCVGYSVISNYLNEQKIGSLIGQIGTSIGVEVIATFLPRVVVDSLFSSLKRADLDIYSLTLEPIAALSVAIPPNMRLLNLALVDIGAGTSDIAIVKNGNIFAYAMVSMGGDRLTEFIAAQYLLDFNQAEALKRRLGETKQVEYSDILGNKNELESEKIINEMQNITNELVHKIAQNILELNQKAPDAVILVGGGSLTPNLTGMLAQELNLPANRVGLRSPESLETLVINSEFLKGPQGVTPLGIAYNSLTVRPIPFIKVKVNNRETVLWNTGKITVAQALLSSGIALSNIYGKPGLGKTVEINGVVKSYKGFLGKAPIIKVNNEDAPLDEMLFDGDVIDFVRGTDGQDAIIRLTNLIPDIPLGYVYVNHEKIALKPKVSINGQVVINMDEEVPDRAKVDFKHIDSVHNVLSLHGVAEIYLQEKHFSYQVKGQDMSLRWIPAKVMINGNPAELNDKVKPNDEIIYDLKALQPKIKDGLETFEFNRITVEVNGQPVKLETVLTQVTCDNRQISVNEELRNNMQLQLENTNTAILSDIFAVVNLDLTTAQGKLVMLVDGEVAGFTTPIREGSRIELIWE